MFDQRGSGRSRPFAEVTNNTTQLLIQDMEKLRKHLNVERWLVFGGSWGSSLGLAYAIDHPDQVSGLVLRGIFLCRDTELTWFLEGIAAVFPEAWQGNSIQFLPEAEQKDVLASYHQRLMSDDPNVHGPAARAWARYEGSCSTLLPSSRGTSGLESDVQLGACRIRSHYFVNKMFLPTPIFSKMYKIRHIPAVFRTGTIRHDMSYGDGGCIGRVAGGPISYHQRRRTFGNGTWGSVGLGSIDGAIQDWRLTVLRSGPVVTKALHPFSAHLV